MDPDQARRLLERFSAETSTDEDENRHCYLAGLILQEQTHGSRAQELAELHLQALRFAGIAKSEQTDEMQRTLARAATHDARAKYDAIIAELLEQHEAQLDADLEAGKEAPWAKWPK